MTKPQKKMSRQRGLLAFVTLVVWTLFVFYLAVISNFMSSLEQGAKRIESKFQRQLRVSRKPPIPIPDVIKFLENWITSLHDRMEALESPYTYREVWREFKNAVEETLIPWDIDYLQRMPERRTDDSIFLSIVSFRDENCFNTLHEAFRKAAHPEKLFVGLNQQNCYKDCKSGVQEDHKVVPVEPDPDCEKLFCESDLGKEYCSHVRVLHVQEADSLGPVEARYFASKLYNGESWYIQMDAHMVFLDEWDRESIEMMHAAPSERPVLSHYPPGHLMDLPAQKPTGRLCGSVFHGGTVRMEGLGKFDHEGLDVPHFAPFIGAGFLIAHADFLREVPFDPMLPYIFMGEEIILSTRLWTAGYDLFSPTRAVVGHIYVRKNKPKFWETVQRFLHVQDALEMLVLERINYQLGFPESARDLQRVPSVLDHVELYGMGKKRPLSEYMRNVGIDVRRKWITDLGWCEAGTPPEYAKHLAHLYKNKTVS